MKYSMLLLLLLSSTIVTLAQYVDHNRHAKPDIEPETFRPLEHFDTTLPPNEHDHHHLHAPNLNEWDNYDPDYEEYYHNTFPITETEEIYTIATENYGLLEFASTPPPETCEANEWKCGNDRCIDASDRCDYLNDCEDGSDEQYCEGSYRQIAFASAMSNAVNWMICLPIIILVIFF